MRKVLQVVEIEDHTMNGAECWLIHQIDMATGEKTTHALPKICIAWRAVEYGIDHTTAEGREQIMDILLHEPHIPPLPPEVMSRHSQGDRRKGDPVHLYNSPHPKAAREAHLARVEKAKSETASVVWKTSPTALAKGGVHPLTDLEPDQRTIDLLSDHVKQTRIGLGLDPTPPAEPLKNAENYDPAVRRRGLMVAIMDSRRE